MRCGFKAVVVFAVLCVTPTSYARYYDPEYGRFLSRDEMEGNLDSAPSLHRSTYAHGNPLRYTDPTGRCVPVVQSDGVQFDCRDLQMEQFVSDTDAQTSRDWEQGNYGNWLGNVGLGVVGRFGLIPSRVNQFVYGNPFNAGSDAVAPYNKAAWSGDWQHFDSAKSIGGWTQIGTTAATTFVPVPNAPTATGRILESALAGATTMGVAEGTRQVATTIATGDSSHLDVSRTVEATATGAVLGAFIQRVLEARNAPGSVTLRSDQLEFKSASVRWVDENASMSSQARDYGAGAEGARSNRVTRVPQAPTISRTTSAGDAAEVRFDGFVEPNGPLIDRKLSVPTFPKSQNQALRQSQALDEAGLRARWEVPTPQEAARATKMFNKLNIENIDVEVVPIKE